jgi:hypothetical protein
MSESICEINECGNKRWYNENGMLHRTDGPAVEFADGSKWWCVNGMIHRIDGPAIEDAIGYKEWWVDGKLHRTDGPAVEYADGYKEWWVNGELHRIDGPAVEFADGSKWWWINGTQYSEEEFKEITEKNRTDKKEDVHTFTDLELGLFISTGLAAVEAYRKSLERNEK